MGMDTAAFGCAGCVIGDSAEASGGLVLAQTIATSAPRSAMVTITEVPQPSRHPYAPGPGANCGSESVGQGVFVPALSSARSAG